MIHDETCSPEHDDSASREALAHGMLSFHFDESEDTRERRVSLAMIAIDRERSESRRLITTPARRALRVILSAAASVALVGLISVYFFSSTEPQALALVQESIKANQNVQIRRFEVRATGLDGAVEQHAHATIDVGSDRRFRFDLNTPDGRRIAGGRGYSGEWAQTPREEIETDKPRALWPRWMFLLDDSLTGSPDEVLAGIERDYEPQLVGTADINGVRCLHLRATRRADPRELPPEPERPAEHSADEGRPHGGPEGEMNAPPGVAPELAQFLPRPPQGEMRPDGQRPPPRGGLPGGPGREGGPMHGMRPMRERFVPPEFIPRGQARERMPALIELWIEEETKIARRIELRWDSQSPSPTRQSDPGRLPGPPKSLEFRLIDAPSLDETAFEIPTQTP